MRKQYIKLLILVTLVVVTSSCCAQYVDSAKAPSEKYFITNSICFKFINNNGWDSALVYAYKLLTLCETEFGKSGEHAASAFFNIGEIYRLKEDYQMAYTCFKKSCLIFDSLNPATIHWWNMYTLAAARVGFMCEKFGSRQEEKQYFEKAINLNKNLHHIADNLQMFLVYGNIYSNDGEYEKADSVYLFIKSVLDTIHKSDYSLYLQASVLSNLADIYSRTGNIAEAIKYSKKALPLEVEAKDSDYIDNDYVDVCLNLSTEYAMNNDIKNAWKLCRQAEDSIPDQHKEYSIAQIAKQKAILYQEQQKYQKAIQLNENYFSIADTMKEVFDDYYDIWVNMGIIYSSINKYEIADSIFKKIITRLQDSGQIYSYTLIQAKKGLCQDLIKEKKYEAAADSLIPLINLNFTALNKNFFGLSEAEKLNYQAEADKIFDLMYICFTKSKTFSQNILHAAYKAELLRKAFVLRSQLNELNNIRSSKDTALINLYYKCQRNSEILARQYSLPYSQRLFNMDSLEEVSNYLSKQVSVKSAVVAQTAETNSNSLMPAHATANIEFVTYNYKSLSATKDSCFYGAFIITSMDTVPHFIYLCSEAQLINLMKDERGKRINENQLTQFLYNSANKKSKHLYKLVWQKLDKQLTIIKYINYSTAGLLNNISFPAIYSEKSFLINKYSFSRYYSLISSYSVMNNIHAPNEINIWADIDYDKATYINISIQKTKNIFLNNAVKNISNKPLERIGIVEAAQLQKIFLKKNKAVHVWENGNATEDNFKQQASSFSGILHISTHGFYTPFRSHHTNSYLPSAYIASVSNPLFRCGLAFAGVNYYWSKGKVNGNHDDGILTGYEISQLNLQHVQLVTLSACETGLGDVTSNEGNIGLLRAFKIAGAKNLLVSLWQVPAKQTSELLILFYKNWLQGKPIDEALRLAELVMQKKYPPYFWAGFILVK